jgi:hypothetical protein
MARRVKNISAIRTHIVDPGCDPQRRCARKAFPGEDPATVKGPEVVGRRHSRSGDERCARWAQDTGGSVKSLYRHPRERGDSVEGRLELDSRFRGNDEEIS